MLRTLQENQHSHSRFITQRYLVALSLVALLSILGQVFIQTTLIQQTNDAHVINIAGRQRMLSQRLSKAALALEQVTSDDQRQSRLAELQFVVPLWESSQQGLQFGDALAGLPGQNSAAVASLFADIQPQFTAMITAAKCLISAYLQDSQDSQSNTCVSNKAQSIDAILSNESSFLVGMDKIVFQYDADATARVDALKRIELALLSITLMVLVLEALLIFRPAVRQLSNTQVALRRTLDELEQRVRERTRELSASNTMLTQEIADRQSAEEERERLIKELEEALLFKDQFLATMSHELRTPLNAVIGYSGIALMEDDVPATVEHMLDRIKINSKRLLDLINDVLDISRINAKRVEILSRPLGLQDLIQGWFEDFRQQIEEKGLAFELAIDPVLPDVIIGDEERLTQITGNLLGNALKFTDQGKIRLSVEGTGNGDQWAIVVADTGIGIPDIAQHLIFDEFRQVDTGSRRKYGGAGLGLSIVKKLCLLMNGTISVSSALGKGSTFTVNLPLKLPILVPQIN